MEWEFTAQVQAYAARTWGLLAARAAENTVALTVIAKVRAGYRWSSDPMLFGWYESGSRVLGAVSMTPPFELLLAEVPAQAMDELVRALLSDDVPVPGVNGDTVIAEAFAAAWTFRVPVRATTTMRQRLYRLTTLRQPTPPPGHARAAHDGDLRPAVDWFTRFQIEAGAHAVDAETAVRDCIDNELLWLWENADGHVVSMAGRNRAAAGVARVGPVYTPPEHRRHGFGAAVTAACTSDALEHGAEQVVLFADLANPTSNAIYQQIGYLPVRDHQVIRFAKR
ncbi:MAG: GNAT family N-acetyltransferase [Pseudonocardiales bacterium]|nr:MAG: GNAT family N-acetyltransferase [Pseudonocardiales bacterium]